MTITQDATDLYNLDQETMATEELDDLIQRRLRYTLSYAQEHSDYWGTRFADAGIVPEDVEGPADLLALPPVTTDEFMAHQPPETDAFEWAIFHDEMSYHSHCTSGTTGVEKWVFVNEHDENMSTEAVRRGYAAAGLDGTTRLANFLPKGLYMSGKQSEDAADGYVRLHEAFGHIDTPPRDRVLALFRDTAAAPDALIASPSTVEQLARELKGYGVDPAGTAVESIMVVGEASSAERRAAIADRFDAVVTDNYAMTELGFAGYQSPACDVDGVHVIEDFRLVLVVDEDERRLVDEGEVGEVWVSTLYPVGMKGGCPMFNYKPGDIARFLGRRSCACGRTHKVITDISRSDNAVPVHQTARLTPWMVEDIIHREQFRPVLSGEYVVIIESRQDPRDTIRILVEKAPRRDDGSNYRAQELRSDFLRVREAETHHVEWAAVETVIREEFLRAHVAFKAFYEGGNLDVQAKVVEPGELPLAGGGKPQRIQLQSSAYE